MQKMARWLNQLEELNWKLIGEQIDRNKVHARELEKREKDRKKELSNFHKLYVAKMKLQERKYVEEMKEEREYYVEWMKLLKRDMKEERVQYMELMQKGLLYLAQKEKDKVQNTTERTRIAAREGDRRTAEILCRPSKGTWGGLQEEDGQESDNTRETARKTSHDDKDTSNPYQAHFSNHTLQVTTQTVREIQSNQRIWTREQQRRKMKAKEHKVTKQT